jgi:hypothetical protein
MPLVIVGCEIALISFVTWKKETGSFNKLDANLPVPGANEQAPVLHVETEENLANR